MATKNGAIKEKPAAGLHSLDLNEQSHGATPFTPPYRMRFIIEGTCPILFHRYDCEAVAGAGGKGKGANKTDNIDTYYYRDGENRVCIPAVGIHGALIESGRWVKDPRSPRASAKELMKAAVIVEPDLVPCIRNGEFIFDAEYLDKRRAQVNRAAISRVRPALMEGWRAEFEVTVLQSDLLHPQWVRDLVARAGQLVGLCDFRPQHGRFQIVHAEVVEA